MIMFRIETLLLTVVASIALLPLQAIELLNPAKPIPEYSIVADVLRKQNAEIAKAPDGVPALKLSWSNADSNKMEFFFENGVNIPEFKKAVIKVQVYLQRESFCRHFSVRLVDEKAEIFQFQKFLNFDTLKDGWQTFEYTIDPSFIDKNPNVRTWGRNANKKFTYPMKFLGFCIDFSARSRNGVIYIGNVSIETVK